MTFLQLYSTQLTIELASSDTTQLWTTARRKKAINDAQLEWVRQTRCCTKYGTIAIVDVTGEYALETNFTDFLGLADDAPSVKVVDGDGNVRWIQGEAFTRRSTNQLDTIDPGWRDVDAGTPIHWYTRQHSGITYLGAYPAPDVGDSETWTWLVPYVCRPPDMSADADVPFTVGGNTLITLEPYHQGLVHYAAGLLEAARKNYAGAQRQMSIFAGFVAKFFQHETEEEDGQATFARNYYGESVRSARPLDPRRFP